MVPVARRVLAILALSVAGLTVAGLSSPAAAVATWTRVSAGGGHTCGINDGRIYCWGFNGDGQLGDATTTDRHAPQPVVSTAADWTSVSAGFSHTCAIRVGRVYCWGANGAGQVGDGTNNDRQPPRLIASTATDWKAVSAGRHHTCAVRAGRIYCWGFNGDGQLGDSTRTSRQTPHLIASTATDWKAVSAGRRHTCAIRVQRVYCWGVNTDGQLGDSTTSIRLAPRLIASTAADWTSVSAGFSHTCAIRVGRVYCWGANGAGQLGVSTTADHHVPRLVVSAATDWASEDMGVNHGCGLRAGRIYCWGNNNTGQLGDTTVAQRDSPRLIAATAADWTSVSAGFSHTCAIRVGRVYCWGANGAGQLGDGSTTSRRWPGLVTPAASGSTLGPELSQPAAWSWFSDPRAVYSNGRTFVGFTSGDGVFVGSYDHVSETWMPTEVGSLASQDDHFNPVLGVRPDGRIIVAWATGGSVRRRISEAPGDARAWGPMGTVLSGHYAYTNLMRLDDGTWWLFSRRLEADGGRTNLYVTSRDEGETWSAPTDWVSSSGRPYAKYSASGSRIDVAISSSHPELTSDNSIFHAYYDGKWRRSDGTAIGEPPFTVDEFTKVYDGSTVKGWTWDVAPGPVMVFATFPSTGDHRYQYATWDGSAWHAREVTAAGGSIDESGDDPYYAGGVVLDHDNPSNVYLSRQVGTGAWDIEHWSTNDGGSSWSSRVLSTAQGKNVRPVVPHGGPVDVLWLSGSYFAYTDWLTRLQSSPALDSG